MLCPLLVDLLLNLCVNIVSPYETDATNLARKVGWRRPLGSYWSFTRGKDRSQLSLSAYSKPT